MATHAAGAVGFRMSPRRPPMLPLLFALVPAVPADDPLPEGSAVLVAHSVLKSEDGKHSVQLATFGFPLTKKDNELLMAIMNSDPYWHHSRMFEVFLLVDDKVYPGGPRVVTRHPWADLV